jgi:WD40 repeat protein
MNFPETDNAHQAKVTCLNFSPSGEYLVSGDSGGTVKVWDVQSGQSRRTFQTTNLSISAIVKVVLVNDEVTAFNSLGQKWRWSFASGQLIGRQDTGNQSTVDRLAIGARVTSADGQTTAVKETGDTVRVGDQLLRHPTEVYTLAISPDGRVAATGGSGQVEEDFGRVTIYWIYLWETQTGRLIHQIVGRDKCFIVTAVYEPDGECHQIDTLRRFRDRSLLTSPIGQRLVDYYYRLSPPLAKWVAARPSIQRLIRMLIDRVVQLIKYCSK